MVLADVHAFLEGRAVATRRSSPAEVCAAAPVGCIMLFFVLDEGDGRGDLGCGLRCGCLAHNAFKRPLHTGICCDKLATTAHDCHTPVLTILRLVDVDTFATAVSPEACGRAITKLTEFTEDGSYHSQPQLPTSRVQVMHVDIRYATLLSALSLRPHTETQNNIRCLPPM